VKPGNLSLAIVLWAASGCTFVGQGEGEVFSDNLSVPTCWFGAFDLDPDFFATVPFRNVQQIRIQHGSDLTEVSDGVAIQVNDAPAIRNRLGEELTVGLPPELLNEIAPGVPQPMEEPPDASLALYLQFSCHNQNKVLYATSGTITFDALFSGDPNESVGAEKLTDARFSVTVADPRSALPGTLEYPDEATSPLEGWFRFHFQRGQPGQPFP